MLETTGSHTTQDGEVSMHAMFRIERNASFARPSNVHLVSDKPSNAYAGQWLTSPGGTLV